MDSTPRELDRSAELELFVEDLGAEELPDTASPVATFGSYGSASCPYFSLSTASSFSSS